MSFQIDPFASEAGFRFYLEKLKEFGELDYLIKFYIENIENKRIYQRPSKGPYGEKGKDIVSIEDENTLDYCSYIIKCGTLQDNLDGDYGIIKQIDDALNIDLEENMYKNKRRTAIVIYNGEEKYRGAINKFEENRVKIQNKLDSRLLLRDIERWDISVLSKKLFSHIDKIREISELKNRINRLFESESIVKDLRDKSQEIDLGTTPTDKLIDRVINRIENSESKWGKF